MTTFTVERVRELGPVEIAELDDLDVRCFPYDAPYPKHGAAWWVVRAPGRGVVAFAGAKYWDPDRCLYLCRAGVLPEARGAGLQRRLIRARLKFARELGCRGVYTDTVTYNPKSSNNLIACGFRTWCPAEPWGGRETVYWWKEIE